MDTNLMNLELGPKMDWTSGVELYSRFRRWKQKCENIFQGPLLKVDEEVKCKYLLMWSGDQGFDQFNSWNLSQDEQKLLASYWTKFEQFVNPNANFLIPRKKLRNLTQNSRPLEEFITDCRLTVLDCGLPADFVEESIRDAIVFGIDNQRIRFKCIAKGNDLTLNDAIKFARTEDCTTQQLKEMDFKDSESIHALYKNKPHNTHQAKNHHSHDYDKRTSHRKPRSQNKSSYQTSQKSSNQQSSGYNNQSNLCQYCGESSHPRSKCPASNKQCQKCKKFGHFARVCKQGQTSNRINTVGTTKFDDLFIGTVESTQEINTLNDQGQTSTKMMLKLSVSTRVKSACQTDVIFQLDTGAETNLITRKIFHQLFPPDYKLKPPSTILLGYGGSRISNLGSCILYIKHNGTEHSVNFNVTDGIGPAILGLNSCLKMNLIQVNFAVNKKDITPKLTRENLLDQYKETFTGIGLFPGAAYHIRLKDDAQPVINPPRSVSIHMQDKFKEELDRMEKIGVISQVTKPTEWVNSFVIVEKGNGRDLRICLDPRDLNKSIQREHYYTRTIDDIIPKVSGAKFFSLLDARSGYWMLKLDEKSSLLTTFSTPFGRYKFERLPFGLIVSQDIFQRKMDEVFRDLTGVSGIADDIFVFGKTEAEHDHNLIQLLKRANENGIKFNPEKLQLKVKETKFFGHTWTPEGLKPDPSKISDIIDMNAPSSKEDLQSFLGMVNYLNRYSPVLATLSSPLRDLIKKNVIFKWYPEHQLSFESVKQEIANLSTLTYYDPRKSNVIQCDASTRGLGATLLQDNKPICYKSSSLTEAEQRYSNIERELLAVVWSLEKFNHFIYGKHVLIQTDHKPLEAIFKKQISIVSPRLQRLLLRTTKYDVTVEYLPGKSNVIADALSRVDPSICKRRDEDDDLPEIRLNLITSSMDATPETIENIKQLTREDQVLNQLEYIIRNGWPNDRAECPHEILDYWNYREDLSVEDGLIFKCQRMVIPSSLREKMLTILHQGHLGVEKCLLKARESVFWPGITLDIKNLISSCSTCQTHQRMQSNEPLLPHELPQYPFQKIGTDIFDFKQKHYLIIVDYFSKFPLVRLLGSGMSAENVVAHTKSIVTEYGIPEIIVSDNGPQYSSELYRIFCQKYNILHHTSSPRYPASNGQAERCIQTVKKLLIKALESGQDANLALLNYRSTPLSHDIPSPAELLSGRQYRTLLPVNQGKLKISAERQNSDQHRSQLKERQNQQKKYYDQHSKPLPELKNGESVRYYCENSKRWEPAIVIARDSLPRSYHILSEKGGRYRRNRKFLRKTHEHFNFDFNYDYDITPSVNNEPPDNNLDDHNVQNENHDQNVVVNNQNDDNENLNHNNDNATKTRSGRLIKPPNRLDL